MVGVELVFADDGVHGALFGREVGVVGGGEGGGGEGEGEEEEEEEREDGGEEEEGGRGREHLGVEGGLTGGMSFDVNDWDVGLEGK